MISLTILIKNQEVGFITTYSLSVEKLKHSFLQRSLNKRDSNIDEEIPITEKEARRNQFQTRILKKYLRNSSIKIEGKINHEK